MDSVEKKTISSNDQPEADKWELPDVGHPYDHTEQSNALGYESDWYKSATLATASEDIEEEQSPLTLEEIESIRQTAYDDGFQEGKEAGFQAGQEEGRIKGEKEGYDEGLVKGREEGLALGRVWIEEKTQEWQSLLDKIAHPLHQVDQNVEQQLVWMAMQLAKSLIKHEVHISPDLLLSSLRDAIKLLPAVEDGVIIALHPDDYAMVSEAFNEEEREKRGWTLQMEPDLQRGDLILTSQTSSIDLLLEKRIEQLFRQFLRQNLDMMP